MKATSLPHDYALVLAQVNDAGTEEFTSLAESLSYDQKRLAHIVRALQHKGLILIRRSDYQDMWIGLTRRGQRLIDSMWPESRLMPQMM
ncbi:hypothetical protein JNJ66_06345 [Candidatus Saccharibacteria bacterium]|nr:hypothetical protein [Candidatus Saccharibacteria bacterium]